VEERPVALKEAVEPRRLESGAWYRRGETFTLCFDLPKGASRLEQHFPIEE
jgi:hypothetical protein